MIDADNLKEFAALATSLIAVWAMVAVGKQEWRRPRDMHARRIVLAALACVAAAHAWSPSWMPEVAQQLVLCGLLVIIAIGSSPLPEKRQRQM